MLRLNQVDTVLKRAPTPGRALERAGAEDICAACGIDVERRQQFREVLVCVQDDLQRRAVTLEERNGGAASGYQQARVVAAQISAGTRGRSNRQPP